MPPTPPSEHFRPRDYDPSRSASPAFPVEPIVKPDPEAVRKHDRRKDLIEKGRRVVLTPVAAVATVTALGVYMYNNARESDATVDRMAARQATSAEPSAHSEYNVLMPEFKIGEQKYQFNGTVELDHADGRRVTLTNPFMDVGTDNITFVAAGNNEGDRVELDSSKWWLTLKDNMRGQTLVVNPNSFKNVSTPLGALPADSYETVTITSTRIGPNGSRILSHDKNGAEFITTYEYSELEK